MYELIIADNECCTLNYVSSLIRETHQEFTVTASNFEGNELLKTIHNKKPNLVITDIMLSGMNGLQVIAEAKKLELPTRFMILSAETRYEYIRAALLLGVDDFLAKPVQPQELKKSLSYILKKLETNDKEYVLYSEIPYTSYSKHVQKAKDFIDHHYADPLSLRYVASKIYLNPTYLGYLFKKEIGISFSDYLTQCRIEMAKHLLKDFHYTSLQTASAVGYQDVKYFRKVFQKKTGLSPASFQKQNRENITSAS